MKINKNSNRLILISLMAMMLQFLAFPAHASFENCFLSLVKFVRPKQHRIVLDNVKKTYRNFDHIVRVQNEAFIDFILKDDRQKSVLFFHLENAVLKDLNDKVFLDKNVSQALNIKYQKIVLEKISHNYFLKKNVLHQYADYKTIRFVFKSKSNESHFKKELARVQAEALIEFKQFLEKSFLNDFLGNRLKRMGTPEIDKWFLSGLSTDPTLSALKARYFRDHPIPEVRNVRNESDIILGFLVEQRERVIKLEEEIMQFYRKNQEELAHSPFNADDLNGNEMISFEMLRIFRKLKDTDGDFENAQMQVFDYLGTIIDRNIFRKHLELIKSINEFSPPVYQPFTRAVSFDPASKGVISIDIANLGLEGLYSLYRRLRGPMASNNLLSQINEAYWPVHHKLMDVYRPMASNLIRSSGLHYVHRIESGDDLLYFFKKRIDFGAIRKIVSNASNTEFPNKFRIVEVPPRYSDSGFRIPEIRMSRFVSRAEKLEKELRNRLRDQYSLDFSRSSSIGVRITPNSAKKSFFEVFIKVKDYQYSSSRLERVLENIKSLNSDVRFEVLD